MVGKAIGHSVVCGTALVVRVLLDVALKGLLGGHHVPSYPCLSIGLHAGLNLDPGVTAPSIRRVILVLEVLGVASILLRGLVLVDYLHRALFHPTHVLERVVSLAPG
jgi:hypothetical protein